MTRSQAMKALLLHGLTPYQINQVIGFGLRNLPGCQNEDTILNKYQAGSLSMFGVMGVLFGGDSPQHHTGNAWGIQKEKLQEVWDAVMRSGLVMQVTDYETLATGTVPSGFPGLPFDTLRPSDHQGGEGHIKGLTSIQKQMLAHDELWGESRKNTYKVGNIPMREGLEEPPWEPVTIESRQEEVPIRPTVKESEGHSPEYKTFLAGFKSQVSLPESQEMPSSHPILDLKGFSIDALEAVFHPPHVLDELRQFPVDPLVFEEVAKFSEVAKFPRKQLGLNDFSEKAIDANCCQPPDDFE